MRGSSSLLSGPRVREATPADAVAVVALHREFAAYLRGLGDTTDFRLDEKAFRRDGFGPHRAFVTLVAESDALIGGYVMYHGGYDADRAVRIVHVIDLYVAPEMRRRGVGRALIAAASTAGREMGATELQWSVFEPNALAFDFYEALGAETVRGLRSMRLALGPH